MGSRFAYLLPGVAVSYPESSASSVSTAAAGSRPLCSTRPAALLVLADGTVFRGESIGAAGKTSGEVVFNTALTGYQEILTDPSYCRQIVTLTYPHIGNVGCNDEDFESGANYAAGLVIRDLPEVASNWRSQSDLSSYLVKHGIVAIAGIDTRKLTRICLLYTSPSPRDYAASRMPSSA